ncbi:hypothetical protein AX16_006516 [Volvariella volvacea WC 439]|nr:hypothetical protein AX16_006516 [Volvariella volvacea WC 439]
MSKFQIPTINNEYSPAALILSPYLFLGSREASSSPFINSHGITHVLSIGARPKSISSSVTYLYLPLHDGPSYPLHEVIEQSCEFIESAKDGKILVHCLAGISRSSSIVTAYLMTKCDMRLKEALGVVIRARPAACPNPGFIRQLKELEKKVYGDFTLEVDWLPMYREDRVAMFNTLGEGEEN